MEKKIKTIIEWGVENIYNTVMTGKITTLDGVIGVLKAVAPLADACSKELPKTAEIDIILPITEKEVL